MAINLNTRVPENSQVLYERGAAVPKGQTTEKCAQGRKPLGLPIAESHGEESTTVHVQLTLDLSWYQKNR